MKMRTVSAALLLAAFQCMSFSAAAQDASPGGCKILSFQTGPQAEAKLTELYSQGWTLISFFIDTRIPEFYYKAVLCKR